MPTLKNPASDLATAITGQSLGGVTVTSGTNLFFRALHPIPIDSAIYLLNLGGPPPDPYVTTAREAIYEAVVQAVTYSAPGEDGYDIGRALVAGFMGYVQQLSVSGYVSVLCNQAQPNYLVDPDTQRHVFTLDVTMRYKA